MYVFLSHAVRRHTWALPLELYSAASKKPVLFLVFLLISAIWKCFHSTHLLTYVRQWLSLPKKMGFTKTADTATPFCASLIVTVLCLAFQV